MEQDDKIEIQFDYSTSHHFVPYFIMSSGETELRWLGGDKCHKSIK